MVAMLDGKRCGEALVLEPSLRTVPYAAGSGKRSFYTASDASPPGEAFVRLVCGLLLCLYGIICPGPLCRRHKRCEMSLGLEKLAVGRSGLLPLRGTANSPFTFVV